MELSGYFEESKGTGVLATASRDGKVDAAIYARPHFTEAGKIAFIMADKLTHENLISNPWAVYLFIEEGKGYKGKRVYLKKIKEEQNEQLIAEICRKCNYQNTEKNRFLVYFDVEKILPLVGSGDK